MGLCGRGLISGKSGNPVCFPCGIMGKGGGKLLELFKPFGVQVPGRAGVKAVFRIMCGLNDAKSGINSFPD